MTKGYPADASVGNPRDASATRSLGPWLLGRLQLLVLPPLNLRLHHGAPQTRATLTAAVVPRHVWLDDQLQDGADHDMQALVPEGHLFTHATLSLAGFEPGLRYPVGTLAATGGLECRDSRPESPVLPRRPGTPREHDEPAVGNPPRGVDQPGPRRNLAAPGPRGMLPPGPRRPEGLLGPTADAAPGRDTPPPVVPPPL